MKKEQAMDFNRAARETGGGRLKKLRDMKFAEVLAEVETLHAEKEMNTGTFDEASPAYDAAKVERYNDLVELYNKMEKYMEPIQKDPTSFDAVLTYGNAPLKELEEVTKGMVVVQGRFAEQVNVMSGVLEGVEGRMSDLKQFGNNAKDVLTRIAKAAGKGGKGFMKILGSLTGTNKKLTEDEKFVEDMQAQLPEKVREMQKLKLQIDSTEKGLDQVMNEAEKLGVARMETTEDLGIYVNCAEEVLRRYDEEYVPDARSEYEQSGHPDDAAYLEKLMETREDFVGRMLTLKTSQATGMLAQEQLRRIITTMKDQRKKLQDIKVNGIPEWTALIVEAGIAGSSLKISQKIAQSDKAADELFDLINGMIEKSDEMTRNAKARGTIDPEKIIEATNKMANLLERDIEDRRKRLEAVQETYNRLDEAHKKLVDASDTNKQARLLESDGNEATKTAPVFKPQNQPAETTPAPKLETPAAPETDAGSASNDNGGFKKKKRSPGA